MLGRTPGRVLAIRPLKDGVIADFEVTEIMLNFFFKKLAIKGMFKRPTSLICCPSNITSVERNAIRDAAYRAGAKKVYIEEEGMRIPLLWPNMPPWRITGVPQGLRR